MYCENCSEPIEMQSVVRQQNRVLRSIVRNLRRNAMKSREAADEIFYALCETDVEAQAAMGELWGSARFDCGPQDYEYIVERCIEALRDYNERHTNPEPVSGNSHRENCGTVKAPPGWTCRRDAGHSGPCVGLPLSEIVY